MGRHEREKKGKKFLYRGKFKRGCHRESFSYSVDCQYTHTKITKKKIPLKKIHSTLNIKIKSFLNSCQKIINFQLCWLDLDTFVFVCCCLLLYKNKMSVFFLYSWNFQCQHTENNFIYRIILKKQQRTNFIFDIVASYK